MEFKVLNDRILVKPDKAKHPDPETIKGVVIAIGNGVVTNAGRLPLTVKIGDTVYYGKYAPTPTASDWGEGLDIHVIREDDVLMYYTED